MPERKTSEAQRRAVAKYEKKEKFKRLSLMMPTEDFERMENHITLRKEKRNAFIRRSINETIDREEKD